MPIGAITMILTNVGLQIYNNWCGSRQNDKLQKKREEFEKAARERNTEHMWKLLREGQELTMQMEKEKHDDRLKELKEEVDHLLERLTYESTITNWPLKVLPIVMKNQAFGNLLANQEEHVAMHVIFTRSNYDKFNKLVYPIVEKDLEQYCDKHWSTVSDHPVLFYSGAWKPMTSPTDVQVKAMREELKNLPTLLITPFFRPGDGTHPDDGKLVFQVHMWGVGPNSSDQFIVPEIEPVSDESHFQRTYTNQQDYETEVGLLDEIVEDLVPYLECMIGYMADTYFWSSAGLAPHLPLLVSNGTINTDGMKYLLYDSCVYYLHLLDTSLENTKSNPFVHNNLHDLYISSAELWDEETKKSKSKECILSFVYAITGKHFCNIEELCKKENLRLLDIVNINKIVEVLSSYGYKNETAIVSSIRNEIAIETEKAVKDEEDILLSTDINRLEDYAQKGICAAIYRLGEIYEYSICCDLDLEKALSFYQDAANRNYLLAIFKIELHHFLVGEKWDKVKINNYAYALKKMVDDGNSQAIIMAVAFSFYKIYDFVADENLLTTLDLVENSGHPYAYYLGAIIIKERYGKKYVEKVLELLNKSAEIGSTQALLELSNIFYEGKIVKKSIKKYLEYSKLAAESGSSEALLNIGYCYATGDGIVKSKSNALKFISLAAEMGNQEAVELLSKI